MASQIKNSPVKTYAELLTSATYCSIPAFQRSYNWKKKQLSSLWESLIENQDHYYIGNMVVINKINDSAEPYFEVVDGQQRLTSLFLIIIALRNFIEKDKNKKNLFKKLKHEEIIRDLNALLVRSSIGEEEGVCRLRFHKKNLNEIFRRLSIGEPDVELLDDNQKNFVRNVQTLGSFIREYFKENASDRITALKSLVDKIKTLEFILIVCGNDSNAYKLFEGLNSTGLDLTVVDLVKNSVFLKANQINPTATSKLENSWQDIENVFETFDLNQFPKFLRHQWIANEGYINTSELFDKIKEEKLSGNLQQIISYVNELKNDAESYVGLKNHDEKLLSKKVNSKHDRTMEGIKKFGLLDAEQVYAVLLAYYKKHISDTDNYTQKNFWKDMDSLWSFAFITRFTDLSPAAYEKKFADRCKQISKYKGKSYNKESDAFYKDLWALVKDKKEEFVSHFSTDLAYSKTDTPLIRYVLQEYLWHGEGSHVTSVKKDEPSIEHILPQEPSKWGFSKVEIESYVDKIGNLTLLGDSENGSIASETFDAKFKSLYHKDVYPKNRGLKKYTERFSNNPDEAIEERGREIGEVVWDIFKIQ